MAAGGRYHTRTVTVSDAGSRGPRSDRRGAKAHGARRPGRRAGDDAARRRRLVRYLARRPAGRADLREARAAAPEGGRALGGAGRAQPVRMGVDAGGAPRRARQRAAARRARRRGRLLRRWGIWIRSGIRSGRSSSGGASRPPETARAVGRRLAVLHAAAAGRDAVREPASPPTRSSTPFASSPTLVATGRRHPDLAPALDALVDRTAGTKRTLVHGDVSPKNILLGSRGPIFLDAECAWYGDPAFDLAFCLNHLLLKCLWTPPAADRFLRWIRRARRRLPRRRRLGAAREGWSGGRRTCFRASCWRASTASRPSSTSPRRRTGTACGRTARPLILAPVDTLGDVRDAWASALERPTH